MSGGITLFCTRSPKIEVLMDEHVRKWIRNRHEILHVRKWIIYISVIAAREPKKVVATKYKVTMLTMKIIYF